MAGDQIRGGKGSVKPRWLLRTFGFSIPLHAAVFGLLYFGGMRLVESEMIRGYGQESRHSLSTAVDTLHLTMQEMPREEQLRRLTEFLSSHQEQRLHLWSPAAEHLAGDLADHPLGEEDAGDVAAFLSEGEDQRFWLLREDGGPFLRGLIRVETDGRCVPCHDAGETRGVLSMTRSLNQEVGDVRRRLGFWIALGILTWAGLMVVINRMTAQAFERSAARVRADLDAGGSGAGAAAPGVAAQILDPTSSALFESLRRHLEEQERREEDFASRLHHADRLASLGRLAAGLAHEIKNPLAGIQGALEILRDQTAVGPPSGERSVSPPPGEAATGPPPGGPDESTHEVYEQMLAELKRVDGTIRGLLRYARPAPPQRQPTDVPVLLEDTVQLLRPGLARRRITLDLETAPDLPRFPLDAEQIRQVLVNLITNAAEAMEPEGKGGSIRVRAAIFPEGSDLVLAIEDDGPGIAEEDRAKIFQPFFTSKFTGTGLGLAVVDSLVARHGGRLELESAPGVGATFYVILPASEGAAAEGGETDREDGG